MISISKYEENKPGEKKPAGKPLMEQPAGKTEVKSAEQPKEEQRLKELEDKLLRLHAEFDNHRKRTEKEHAELATANRAMLVMELLPVVGQLELALEHEKTDSEFRKGIEMIYKNLLATLRVAGLEEMHATGRFDPYLHEAIKTENGEDGKILAVVQKGYLFKGKILRHAKVIVGRKPEKKEEK